MRLRQGAAVSAAGSSVRRSANRSYLGGGKLVIGSLGLLVLAGGVAERGAVASAVALVLVAAFVAAAARRRFRGGDAYHLGAVAEERVGARLAGVARRPGWKVEHDVTKPGGGNLDHVVHVEGTTFVIDTKRSRCRPSDIGQALRHARWAAERYGRYRRYVPIVCVERSRAGVRDKDGVSVVSAFGLVSALDALR